MKNLNKALLALAYASPEKLFDLCMSSPAAGILLDRLQETIAQADAQDAKFRATYLEEAK